MNRTLRLTQFWPSGGLWRHADFLRLWGAQVTSAFGSKITRTALPIIAILSIDANATEIGILAALGVAPGAVIGLFAGGYIDRTAKRPLLIGADLMRALLILTIPLAAAFGVLSMPQLYAVAAAVGAATVLFQIADNTYLPTLIGTDNVLEGNAKLEATESIAEATGPGLGGILIQILTAPVAMIVDALTYLWSAVLLSRIRTQERPAGEVETRSSNVLGDALTGFRVCLGHRLVGAILLAEALVYFFAGFYFSLYMILALDTLSLSPAVAGIIISVGGIGAFAGAITAGPLDRLVGTGPAMVIALTLGQAANLLIALASGGGPLAIPYLVAQQLVGDAALSVYMIHSISLRQRVLPEGVLGRANATFHVASGLMLPAGALTAGPLADAIGLPPTLWIGAVGGLFAALFLIASPILRHR